MSTAALLDVDERIAKTAADCIELAKRKRERPIDFYRPLPHGQAFHRSSAKERWLVGGNGAGKTEIGGAETVALVAGGWIKADGSRHSWWAGEPSEIWCGAVSLADSAAIQRAKVRSLIPRSLIRRWVGEDNPRSESELYLRNGWVVRFKAYEQGRERWQGGECALVWFDEEPPADIYDEGFARTRMGGRIITTFTPLNGLRWAEAYERIYTPWLEYRREHPGAKWGDVSPDVFVATAGTADNPHVPREEVEAQRRKFENRPLMLRVRLNGEWLDTNEDAIVPVDKLQEHEYTLADPPKGGWARVVAWIDSAFSKSSTVTKPGRESDRYCISIAASDVEGRLYLLEQRFGRYEADERVRVAVDCLRDNGWPSCFVQRTTPDMEFAHRVNDALMREGRAANVVGWPATGSVPGKVERAHAFAVCVGNRQVFVGPEHREFRREAGSFPHAPHDDVFDAGMGALMVLTEIGSSESVGDVMRDAFRGPVPDQFLTPKVKPESWWDGSSGVGNLGGVD